MTDPHIGGGVAIYMYVNSDMKSACRLDLESDSLELLYIQLGSNRVSTLLGCLYRPPPAPVAYFEELTTHIEHVEMTFTGSIVLVGDFNVDVSNTSSPQYPYLQHFCQNFNFSNLVTDVTRVGTQGSRSIIDLILAHPGVVTCCSVLQTCISDHFTLRFQIQTAADHCRPLVRESRNLYRVDMDMVVQDLQAADLGRVCAGDGDIDSLWKWWIEAVTKILNKYAPLRKYRPKAKHNCRAPWKTPEYHDLVKLRDKAHRRWLCESGDHVLREQFCQARSDTKRLARKLKATYYENIFVACASDSRKTWRMVKSLTGDARQPEVPRVTADQLSSQFGGVVTDTTRPATLNVAFGPAAKDCLTEFQPIAAADMEYLLSQVNANKATGSDGIPCRWLKHAAPCLAPSLAYLVNRSLAEGRVPEVLKVAHITPLFKSGDREIPKNYRPVSLLPVISKLLEKVVHRQLASYLQRTAQYLPAQFAYRHSHSTEDAVMYAVDRYLAARDSHQHTGLALIDMSKAFDKVKHQVLVNDLQRIGIASIALSWFVSYLSQRKQQVVLSTGEKSAMVECTCGVPQGSVLGPVLFSIYTSNVPKVVPPGSHVQMFADDIMVDVSALDVSTIDDCLSKAVSNLAGHLRSRGLILNETKTQVLGIHATRGQELKLTVSCEGTQLAQTKTAKYLGITLDDQLSWKAQVSSTVQKVSYRLIQLWRIRPFLSTTLATSLYRALLVSNMMYGSNAYWSGLNATLQGRLKRLDKRCIRFAARAPPLSHTEPIYRMLNVHPTHQLAEDKLKVITYRCQQLTISSLISSRLVPLSQVSTILTRGADIGNFVLPPAHTAHGLCRPLFRAATLWNNLPAACKHCTTLQLFNASLP